MFVRAIAALVLVGCTGHAPAFEAAPQGASAALGDEVESPMRPPSLVGPGVEAPRAESVAAHRMGAWDLMTRAQVGAAIGREVAVAAADLPLAGIVAVLAGGQVSDLAELELLLNAPGLGVHRVDIDGDGALDRLEIRERRMDASMEFYVLAVPASAPAASLPLALIEVWPNLSLGMVVVSGALTSWVAGGDAVRTMRTLPGVLRDGLEVRGGSASAEFVRWALDRARRDFVGGGAAKRDADGGVCLGAAAMSVARLGALRRTIAAGEAADVWQRATEAGRAAWGERRAARAR